MVKNFKGFDDYLSKIVKYDFEKSRKFVRALKLKTIDDWNKYKQSKIFQNFFILTHREHLEHKVGCKTEINTRGYTTILV